MEHIGRAIKKGKLINNVINVNVNNSNNDSNVNNVANKIGKYALDRKIFTPHTPETQLAEEIATYFNDLQNFAFYWHVVKRLRTDGAYRFWRSTQEEIKEKSTGKYPVMNPKKYFAWKFKRGLYR